MVLVLHPVMIMWLIFAICKPWGSRRTTKGASGAAREQKGALPRFGGLFLSVELDGISQESAERKGVTMQKSSVYLSVPSYCESGERVCLTLDMCHMHTYVCTNCIAVIR